MVSMRLLSVALATTALSSATVPWANWAKNWAFSPADILTASTEADVLAIVRNASIVRLKPIGTGHSFSPVDGQHDDGFMLRLTPPTSPADGVVLLSPTIVRAHAGLQLFQLSDVLESKYGLALANLGAISTQTLAGATGTNTHGTGPTGGLSTFIVSMRIVLPNGTAVTANATTNAALFRSARVGWGVLGIIISLDLTVVPQFRMEQILAPMSVATLFAGLPAWLIQYPRLQWYYTPFDDSSAHLLIRQPTTAPITGCWNGSRYATPLTPAPEGLASWPAGTTACTDVSHKTMTRDGDDDVLYTEMEMMVPVANTSAIVNDFRGVMEGLKPQWNVSVPLFFGVRYVKGDDIPLSPFVGRDSR